MTRHESMVRLRHMLDHAREAVEMVKGRVRSDLDTDRQLNLSLVRLLEIIGEAASRVPREECDRYPDIPWSDIVGLRNRLIHGYDDVDFDILWQILTDDLPPFISDALVKSRKTHIFVIPAKAGIQFFQQVINLLDTGFHRCDDFLRFHHISVGKNYRFRESLLNVSVSKYRRRK
ncbi:MAG: DUF86 domain-containing protein [Nitrospirae bacterium]|nr:DUF86 domain-containing protein [Nitrospirota bacterium]